MPPKRSRPSTPSSPGAAGGRARLATPTPPVTPERQSPVYPSFGASFPTPPPPPSRPSRPARTRTATVPQDMMQGPVPPFMPAQQPTPAGSAAPSPAPSSGTPTPPPTQGGRQGFKLKQPQYSMPKEGAARGSYFRDRGINFGPPRKRTNAERIAFIKNIQAAVRRARMPTKGARRGAASVGLPLPKNIAKMLGYKV